MLSFHPSNSSLFQRDCEFQTGLSLTLNVFKSEDFICCCFLRAFGSMTSDMYLLLYLKAFNLPFSQLEVKAIYQKD